MKDLLGDEIPAEREKETGDKDRRYRNARGSAAPQGSGPAGETCKTCANCYIHHGNGRKNWYKCKLVKPTHGAATDIRLKFKACSFWKKAESDGGISG